jgi:site-specific DNA-methyltransferase (adenine-specific)
MKAYRKTDNYTLYLADAWEVLDSLPENSIDAVVTDPPYEIGFMNKGWDNTGVAFDRTTWEKVLRVLKPGGHILAFNHSRTFHRMAVAIEDAGFEIRDTIMWLYGSGFPKSHDISKAIDRNNGVINDDWPKIEMKNDTEVGKISKNYRCGVCGKPFASGNPCQCDRRPKAATEEAKQWEGWGTALKPAYEPILLARKPIPTTVADNVLTHGVGGLNIDECRVESEPELAKNWQRNQSQSAKDGGVAMNKGFDTIDLSGYTPNGRFPANIIHDGSEEVVDGFPETVSGTLSPHHNIGNGGIEKFSVNKYKEHTLKDYGGDSGSASRFFYTAKASKKDRDEGLLRDAIAIGDGRNKSIDNAFQRGETPRRNIHPTVKPTDLMQYLIRLIAPKGATVLDIFMGSGSTGKAAMIENVERDANYHFIGIDRTEEYMPIAEARIEFGLHYLAEKPKADGVVHTDQIDLFSLL